MQASGLVEVPYLMVQATVMVVISYFMVGFQHSAWKFFYFLLMYFMSLTMVGGILHASWAQLAGPAGTQLAGPAWVQSEGAGTDAACLPALGAKIRATASAHPPAPQQR